MGKREKVFPMALKRKVVALLSGGLDSMLAVKLVQDQGIEVLGLHFVNPFDPPEKVEEGMAARSARQLGIPVRLIDKGPEFIDLIRHPRYGFGSALNPCIDCRIFILKRAKATMEEEEAMAIVTGEVVSQRPMSQMRQQLDLIERAAGLEGYLLRPLSAKLLPPTRAELEGVVDREKLENIHGRSRQRQLALAKRFGLVDFKSGLGGCLLTDEVYARKLQDLYDHRDQLAKDDFLLLNIGRHFRFDSETKFISGRREDENTALERYLASGRTLFRPVDFAGPSILLDGPDSERNRRRVLMIVRAYTKPTAETVGKPIIMEALAPDGGREEVSFAWETVDRQELMKWRLM